MPNQRAAGRLLLLGEAIARHDGLSVVLCQDMPMVEQLEREVLFFSHQAPQIFRFPDIETLPYDQFSPHQDIVSERIACLASLPQAGKAVLFLSVSTLLQKTAPSDFIRQRSLNLQVGETIDLEAFRAQLSELGYRHAGQVSEHGEFCARGSLLDLYPMGSPLPFRIDLFDTEIESIRVFDPETQRTTDRVDSIELYPAQEYPLDDSGIQLFRRQFREVFEVDPKRCPVYADVSEGITSPGIEYYLPLFFDQLQSLFDYLPENTQFLIDSEATEHGEQFLQQVHNRYESRRYDIEWPLLQPSELFLEIDELEHHLQRFPVTYLQQKSLQSETTTQVNCGSDGVPQLLIQGHSEQPEQALRRFIDNSSFKQILFSAESAGRREFLQEILGHYGIRPSLVKTWGDFLSYQDQKFCLIDSPLLTGMTLRQQGVAIITENQLFGERAGQRRRRKYRKTRDAESMIQSLADLSIGAAVVHEDHGVGRYLGLKTLTVGGVETEFLCIEYANEDKLYVPVSSLHLISRYSGNSETNAPLHRLGGDQWQKTRRKAQEKIHDVAVELLEIQARRQALSGFSHALAMDEYNQFASEFPFEETPDQELAIEAVMSDMESTVPMDRIVCGDVGFGKTEVSMRAAFIAANAGKQVVMLVPTTLLAQQHYQNFQDRFAEWPLKIACLTRFTAKKQLQQQMQEIADGKTDIVIGTHKLLSEEIRYQNLGLVIIDEEHRFGVRHKEKLKALRANVDLLTMTATPIPRTLNMSMSGLRDLSIIATPPMQRLAIKTFVSRWNEDLVIEGCQRELKRGGQVYFLHNEVRTIEKTASELQELLPEARIGIVHGQMKEKELEQVMLDFYHHRCNLLVCTTIIESGIDVPTANTIFINRADKLGLAQLHQIRGRVGRSHHRAYAYLIVPAERSMTADAKKRLQAIESLEELGVGFTLATHDLEIRGAGEILGEEQSGQINEIGFTLYSELLERAVRSIRENKDADFETPLMRASEIEFHSPALIPETYIADAHHRLVEYKRIASAADDEALRDIQIELIDRFGLMPDSLKNLFRVTQIKLQTAPMGIEKIDVGETDGKIVFSEKPSIEPMNIIGLIQSEPHTYRFDGKQTLRFVCQDDELEGRFKQVEELLTHLAA